MNRDIAPTMVGFRANLAAALVHSSNVFAEAQSADDASVTIASHEGVLLLRNGSALQGQISRSGDRWLVKRTGRELYIPAQNVDLACGSMNEAYEAQRRRVARPNVDAHLSLATWCLANNLLPQAENELLAARGLEADHPRLALLEERLVVARRAQSVRPATPAAPAPAANTASPPSVTQATGALPPLSDEIIERFTRRVQPILINNCTTAGCHQPGGGQKFQLDRALVHGLSNRRTTMSNLAATIALVDRTRPQLSPLITVPRMPHGGQREPVFGPRDSKLLGHLIDWVDLVSEAETAKAPPTIPDENDASPKSRDAGVRPAVHEAPVGTEQSKPSVRYGAELKTWRPKDPFDPEIFNRRFHGMPEESR
jgi:hypothetical protein